MKFVTVAMTLLMLGVWIFHKGGAGLSPAIR
jgi:hypothetical protein